MFYYPEDVYPSIEVELGLSGQEYFSAPPPATTSASTTSSIGKTKTKKKKANVPSQAELKDDEIPIPPTTLASQIEDDQATDTQFSKSKHSTLYSDIARYLNEITSLLNIKRGKSVTKETRNKVIDNTNKALDCLTKLYNKESAPGPGPNTPACPISANINNNGTSSYPNTNETVTNQQNISINPQELAKVIGNELRTEFARARILPSTTQSHQVSYANVASSGPPASSSSTVRPASCPPGPALILSVSPTDNTAKQPSDKQPAATLNTRERAVSVLQELINFSTTKYTPSAVTTLPNGKIRVEFDTSAHRDDALARINQSSSTTGASAENEHAEPTSSTRKRTQIPPKLTQRENRDIARAERMARRLVANCETVDTQKVATKSLHPRIVLTGMDRTERQTVCNAISALNGRVQSHVNKRTTHVLLGTFRSDNSGNCSGVTVINNVSIPNTGGTVPKNTSQGPAINRVINRVGNKREHTFNALAGAARGARVLYAEWALDSLAVQRWVHHHPYEVPHLKKISLKARVERAALGKQKSKYAYDVFNGMRILLSASAEQRDSAKQLLELCGAVVQDGDQRQDGGGRKEDGGCDITIGTRDGEVSSKWVFDSVAASRMRTIRRYVNKSIGDASRIML